MYKKVIKGFILSLFFMQFCQAQIVKYGNEFLSIGVGASAYGMSGAYVARTNDVISTYWNPAGLANIKTDAQLSLMHNEHFAGIIKYDYAGFARKIAKDNTIGLSVIRMGVDDIPNTLTLIDENGNIDYSNISSFSVADWAFMFSYARKVNNVEGLSYGANAKVIYRMVGDFANAWGFGIDIGAQYQNNGLRAGIMGRDITSTLTSWVFHNDDTLINTFLATGNEIPQNSIEIALPRVIIGCGYLIKIKDNFGIYPELDFEITTDNKRNTIIKSNPFSIDPKFGLEFSYKDFIFLRGGLGGFQYVTDLDDNKQLTFQPNMGVGVKIKKIFLDYALTDIADQSIALYSNVFSLRIDLGKSSGRF
jgi:hypothetical protein